MGTTQHSRTGSESQPHPEPQEQLNADCETRPNGPLATDKWLMLQATTRRDTAVADVKRHTAHPGCNRRNHNCIRSLIGAFAMGNFEQFHHADGRGYRLPPDFMNELDPVNPQIASRLMQALIRYRRLAELRQGLLTDQSQRVMRAD